MSGPVGYKNLAASGAFVAAGPGLVYGATLTAGSDAATAILYDNTAGSGTVILKLGAATAGTTTSISIPNGVAFGVGCYVALTGTAPSCSVFGG